MDCDLIGTVAAAGATEPSAPAAAWWQSPFQMFQSNLRATDGGLDVEGSVDLIQEMGYDTWLLNAGGVAYFYPVDGDDQPRSASAAARPSGDLVGDALTACRAAGMRLVARFDFSRLPVEILQQHRDWAHRSADGDVCIADGLMNICPRSDLYEVRGFEILRDFLARYDVDGVFFNWMQFPEFSYDGDYYGPCTCDRCTAAFLARHPDDAYPRSMQDSTYRRLLAVNREHLATLSSRYRELVRSIRPGAALFLSDARQDMVFLETNSPMGGRDDWWQHTPSELASVSVTAHPDLPALVHSSVNVGIPYRLIGEEPAQFARYFAQAIARGARPSTVVVAAPTRDHFRAFSASTPLLQLYRAERSRYAALRPAASVGLFRPIGGSAMAALQERSDFSEYRGIFESLQQQHIPFDVLGVEHIDALVERDALSRYRALIVPWGVQLDARVVEVLRAFVADGGRLLSTGDPTAIVELPEGARLVEELEGARDLGGRFAIADSDHAGRDRMPVIGRLWGVAGTTGTDWRLSEKAPLGPPEITFGNEAASDYTLRYHVPLGAGLASVMPWTAGSTQRTSGLTSVQRFIADEVEELLDGALDVRAELPTSVELVVGRSGAETMLHLINHAGGRQDRLVDPPRVHGRVTIVRGFATPSSAISLRSGRTLELRPVADGVALDVTVDDLEVIVLV